MYNGDASYLLATSEADRDVFMEQKAVTDEIMTVQEVADYLRISRTTAWRWCNGPAACLSHWAGVAHQAGGAGGDDSPERGRAP